MVEASIEGVVVATNDGAQFLVLLKTSEGEVLPIVIGPLEARSIALGLSGENVGRPQTHDLMMSMLEMLSATVKRVEITALRDSTYYASLVLESRGTEFDIDARPSDSLAIAARASVPILIAREVLEQADTVPVGSEGLEA